MTMAQRLNAMADMHNASPHVLRMGTLFTQTVLLDIDGEQFYLHFEKGVCTYIQVGISKKTPWRFAFRTDTDALNAFWRPLPAPGFHDIFGLVKIGRGQIDGDILCLVKNLRFFKEFMAQGRKIGDTTC